MFRPVFGCSLEDHLRVNDREIAFVLEECVLYLLENAIDVEVLMSSIIKTICASLFHVANYSIL